MGIKDHLNVRHMIMGIIKKEIIQMEEQQLQVRNLLLAIRSKVIN